MFYHPWLYSFHGVMAWASSLWHWYAIPSWHMQAIADAAICYDAEQVYERWRSKAQQTRGDSLAAGFAV